MLVITIENPLATAAGLAGNILSFLVVLAPMPTFYKIYKKKSTEEFGSVPYMVGLFSAMMWIYYGALTMDFLLLSINVGASLIETAYLILFLIYAPAKPRAFTLKLVSLFNVGAYGSVVLFTMLFLRGGRRTNIAGWICASFAFSCFVAPLSIIKQVIRTKSVEYMPISLSFFLTVSAIAWLSYGLLLGDLHVALPNVVGFLFGVAQIIIYLVYKNAKKDDTKTKLGNQPAEAMATAVTSGSDIELPEKMSTPQAEV